MMYAAKASLSLACFPRHTPARAMTLAREFPYSTSNVQICPQNTGTLLPETLDELMQANPHTQFRLHANCHVVPDMRIVADLADMGNDNFLPYFQMLAAASQRLRARAYTLHAGRRQTGASLAELTSHLSRLEDMFQCRVGVEGMYPGAGFLLDTWEEYQWLLESGVDFALDLSHLHILARHAGHNIALTQELLSSEHCIEVHVSQNDGIRDIHSAITRQEWWHDLLAAAHPQSVIFIESDLRPMIEKPATDSSDKSL